MVDFNRDADPFEQMSRADFERLIERETSQLTDGDWDAIRKMLVIEREAAGAAQFTIDPLRRHPNPKNSPVVRRKALDLLTNQGGQT